MTKVLIVEDNEMNRDMLGRRLTRKGYEIVFALNGQEAIDMASSVHPDIILMDLTLPIITGWDATKHIRTMEDASKIPIIALTAHAMAGDREKALEAGCDDYVTKPIELEILLGKMDELLKNKKQ
jgi:two-component system cell cycle response regulator DivK